MNGSEESNASSSGSRDVRWHRGHVTRSDRERLHGHGSCVVWFTGFSASGKSTISHYVEKILHDSGCSTYVFDGDNVRHGLCGDLGFSREERMENIRRIGEMANLFIDAGTIAITAFISPYREDRRRVREMVGENNFFEIFVDCPLEVCVERDPKGIYARAKKGEIDNFTGISAPYEAPVFPDLVIKSHEEDFLAAAGRVVDLLRNRGIIGF